MASRQKKKPETDIRAAAFHVRRAAGIVGGTARLAELVGVTPAMVYHWANGRERVAAERCPIIEAVTGHAVRCEQLRPDVPWHVLRERPRRQRKAGEAA